MMHGIPGAHPPGSGDHVSSGVQFGIMSALRTGNVIFDTLICLIIPVIFTMLGTTGKHFEAFVDSIVSLVGGRDRYIFFTIKDEFLMNNWGMCRSDEGGQRNDILQKAIGLFINEMKHVNYEAGAEVNFTSIQEGGGHRRYYGYGGDDDESSSSSSAVDQMRRYDFRLLPMPHAYIDLEPGLSFMRTISEDEGGEQKKGPPRRVVTFTLRSLNPNGQQRIDEFLRRVKASYLKKLEESQDHSRYLYVMQKNNSADSKDKNNAAGGGGGDGSPGDAAAGDGHMFKRYKLSDEKTFDTLFFRKKEKLLTMLNHFTAKSGKYAIKGYPHKLGLLLHGPPGTGKTSLIKALAQHTGRSVVTIPLSRIDTNQELMNIMFDQKFPIAGEDMPVRLNFKDVIFVMEDVDAASSIVLSRESKEEKDKKKHGHNNNNNNRDRETTTTVDAHAPAPAAHNSNNSGDNNVDALGPPLAEETNINDDETTTIAGTATPGKLSRQVSKAVTTTTTADHNTTTLDSILRMAKEEDAKALQQKQTATTTTTPSPVPEVSATTTDATTAATTAAAEGMALVASVLSQAMQTKNDFVLFDDSKEKAEKAMKADKLDLAGLLNILDGVVDTPGRIFVMTSNHPERLDAALIRPGRVDQILYLGYMKEAQAKQLLSHYFATELTPTQQRRLSEILEFGESSVPSSKQQQQQGFLEDEEDDDDEDEDNPLRGSHFRTALAYNNNNINSNNKKVIPRFTPAELEQLCCECETVDELLDELQQRASLFSRLQQSKPTVTRQLSVSKTSN